MFGHQDDFQQPQTAPWSQDAPQSAPSAGSPQPEPVAQPTYQPADNPPLIEAAEADGQTPPPSAPVTDPPSDQPSGGSGDPLMNIKQQALQQLSPLVGQLDQSAEEKFRTTMMMIQASDNRDLIPVAYEAANQIPDEKARAQALLDIVNEINYFTQH